MILTEFAEIPCGRGWRLTSGRPSPDESMTVQFSHRNHAAPLPKYAHYGRLVPLTLLIKVKTVAKLQ